VILKPYGFSGIIFAFQTREANITWAEPKYHCVEIQLAVGEYNFKGIPKKIAARVSDDFIVRN